MSKPFFSTPLVAKKLVVANEGEINFEMGENKVVLQANENLATNLYLTLPLDAGQDGYVLKTNGSGLLSWVEFTGSAAGNNTQLQYNNNGVLGGLWNFNLIDGHFLIGDDDGNTKLYFRSIGNNTYLNSNAGGHLLMHTDDSLFLDATHDENPNAGIIHIRANDTIHIFGQNGIHINSNSSIESYTLGGVDIETDEYIYMYSQNDTIQLESNINSNNAVTLMANNGAVKLYGKRMIQNMERLSVGDGGNISATTTYGTVRHPEAPIIYLYAIEDEPANNYHWDLRGFGVEGQFLTIFYDKSRTPSDVFLHVEFGDSGLITGSGVASCLVFKAQGESAQLICIPNNFGTPFWYIINTGAQVIYYD